MFLLVNKFNFKYYSYSNPFPPIRQGTTILLRPSQVELSSFELCYALEKTGTTTAIIHLTKTINTD